MATIFGRGQLQLDPPERPSSAFDSPERRQRPASAFERQNSPEKERRPALKRRHASAAQDGPEERKPVLKKRHESAAQDSRPSCLAVAGSGCYVDAGWFRDNMEHIAEADRLIGIALADRKNFCEHTSPETHKICDDIFNNILKVGPQGGGNNSVLLLGEAGSGKTHVVERCIKELLQVEPNTVVLRARGSVYATDVECLRHLATQMTSKLDSVPHANASFKSGMDWIKSVFKGSFKKARAMVMVLDQFEFFCSRARQTLLYNLFDIAQEAGVHLSVIGMSEKLDVMDSLEKRIRSRFSMRCLKCFLPTTMDGLVQVLMARLKLPADCCLTTPFVNQFSKYVESSLFAKREEWKPHLELGRSPSWFLAQILPLASLLCEACPGEVSKKRARLAYLPSCTNHQATMLLLDSLTEADHIVLIALYRLRARSLSRTLSTVLHEIQLLHETPGHSLLHTFNDDLYSIAFDTLIRLKLVELARSGATDTATCHLPCASSVDRLYGDLVRELDNAEPASWRNPLRRLPQSIQQWAGRQRAKN